MTNQQYAKLTTGLVAAWFTLTLAASAMHLFRGAPGRPPFAIALATLLPIAVFLIWFRVSGNFRRFALALDLRALTMVQTWRLVGFTFLALYSYRILPCVFALPAGWGDIAIGVTAPFVALKLAVPARRHSFMVWQVLGILDLVAAVGLGATAAVLNPSGAQADTLSVLPLSVIPTFGVPLTLMLHFISIAQALRWPAQPVFAGQRLPSSAI